ncbi:hypothetical protein PVAP13_4NG243500 [Panicum virgatum]|uniref:Uncharacterized protein n=1 Tax=Panicum virgatum TaxID=38727 RepID=A0A8T0THA0_PANVG|nr:hypothetical protein PVAP13_4NG243500 [Panicum virgatum]
MVTSPAPDVAIFFSDRRVRQRERPPSRRRRRRVAFPLGPSQQRGRGPARRPPPAARRPVPTQKGSRAVAGRASCVRPCAARRPPGPVPACRATQTRPRRGHTPAASASPRAKPNRRASRQPRRGRVTRRAPPTSSPRRAAPRRARHCARGRQLPPLGSCCHLLLPSSLPNKAGWGCAEPDGLPLALAPRHARALRHLLLPRRLAAAAPPHRGLSSSSSYSAFAYASRARSLGVRPARPRAALHGTGGAFLLDSPNTRRARPVWLPWRSVGSRRVAGEGKRIGGAVFAAANTPARVLADGFAASGLASFWNRRRAGA